VFRKPPSVPPSTVLIFHEVTASPCGAFDPSHKHMISERTPTHPARPNGVCRAIELTELTFPGDRELACVFGQSGNGVPLPGDGHGNTGTASS